MRSLSKCVTTEINCLLKRPLSKALRTMLAIGVGLAIVFHHGPAQSRSEEAVPACETNLAKRLDKLNVPGIAAAIVKDGRLVCAGAAGMANIETNLPVTPETLFLVASISKTVTATALMQLHEQGKFKLDNDVNDFLPFRVEIPASPKSRISFRQLLTHVSSIDDNGAYINCPGRCGYGSSPISFVTRGADSPISLRDLTEGYFKKDGAYYDAEANFLAKAPGTQYKYSNMGITLVGYLVEVLSGTPFDKYCQTHILEPLGMRKSSWRLAGIDQSILAVPYDKDTSGFIPYGHYGEPDYPDGMLRTSVVELAKFLAAYMRGGTYEGHRILKSETVAKMLKSQTSVSKHQGLAWYRDSIDGRKVWGHEGSDNGACAAMWLDPRENTGVIIMANGVCEKEDALVTKLFEEADDY
jgi:CubicO group peptidase (beta-lactamase class C family)